MSEKIITSDGYAIVLFSKDTVRETLKKAKIRKKDLTDLFDEDPNFSELMMTSGAILPIITESINDYFFDIYLNESDTFSDLEWELLKEEGPFNLNIMNDEIWIGAISNLYEWDYKKYDVTSSILGYETLDGVNGKVSFIYEAQKVNLDGGIYEVYVQGYKKRPYQV
ncbi:hypothetical protein R8G61_05535 [Tenacibaculum maritimum]